MLMMFSPKSTSLFIAISIVAVLHLQSATASTPPSEKVVHIYDWIQTNNSVQPPSPLKVHCHSKSQDAGTWTLEEKQEFEFHIQVGTTLFWCDFSWGFKAKSFPVYDANHDDFPNQTHHGWLVSERGFFFSAADDPGPDEFMFVYSWANDRSLKF
ncbi:unnamed protein product [Cuscuta campestris]|uniref:S-protein homolog n=1 Tax=Cuscuta campestris TaxID=132261 RepID=A0A484NS11_9ASTE|nr:unnamed protein product [Cuscuta campestris]